MVTVQYSNDYKDDKNEAAFEDLRHDIIRVQSAGRGRGRGTDKGMKAGKFKGTGRGTDRYKGKESVSDQQLGEKGPLKHQHHQQDKRGLRH
ncbi:hypothetical protein P3S67_031616 [Capsicum chacoense]